MTKKGIIIGFIMLIIIITIKSSVHIKYGFFKMSKVSQLTIFYPFNLNLIFYNLATIDSNIIQKHYACVEMIMNSKCCVDF